MDDLQAIKRLKRGDIGGLSALVERYQVRALRTAFLITQDAALAQDVVQDTFLSAYRSIRSFDTRRPFGPWFMRSVVNGAIKAAKRGQHVVLFAVDDDEVAVDFVPDSEPSLEDVIETAQTEQAVWDALATLSPERRAVIVLRYYLDLSEAEMAEQFNIPTGTVKSRLYAAKGQLRDLLRVRLNEQEV
jgi:RNA polymerase sigma-70 factor, ECF subfamily